MATANEPLPLAFYLARLLFCLALVVATYNPTGYSFFHWIADFTAGPPSVKAVVAVLLAMVYYTLFRVVFAAFRRSGLIVAILAAALLAGEVVSLLVGRHQPHAWQFYVLVIQYAALGALAVVLSFGVSWSHLVERLTGQLQKRYVRR